MRNATVLYKKPDIQFFLNAGPMENATMNGTLQAIAMASAAGLKATFVDARRACVSRFGFTGAITRHLLRTNKLVVYGR